MFTIIWHDISPILIVFVLFSLSYLQIPKTNKGVSSFSSQNHMFIYANEIASNFSTPSKKKGNESHILLKFILTQNLGNGNS